jgi:hypothetical protein
MVPNQPKRANLLASRRIAEIVAALSRLGTPGDGALQVLENQQEGWLSPV